VETGEGSEEGLLNELHRLRKRVRELEGGAAGHFRAEEDLPKVREILEDVTFSNTVALARKVRERTEELTRANEELLAEITERRRAESALSWELSVSKATAALSRELICPGLSVEEISDAVLRCAKHLTKSEYGYVSFIDPRTAENVSYTGPDIMGLECRLQEGVSRIAFPPAPDGRYPGLWGHALNTRAAFLTNSPAEHEAFRGLPEGLVSIRNFLAAPVLIGEELVGQLALANAPAGYRPRELEAAERLAGLFAMALHRNRVEAALKEAMARAEDEKAKSEAIVQCLGDGVSIQDREFRILYQNTHHIALHGHRVGEYCYEAYAGRDAVCDACPVAMAMEDGNVHSAEMTKNLPDGKLSVEITASPLRDAAGRTGGGIEIVRNITKRREMEDALRRTAKEREMLLKEVHHRVKNNLAVIASLLSLQSGQVEDVRARGLFRESQSRVHSVSLIHEKLYRSEDLKKINFKEYLRDLSARVFRTFGAESSSVSLAMEVEEAALDVDVVIPCGLIVNELLSNALKYAFPDGRKGQVQVRFSHAVDGLCTLSVRDNGVGLPGGLDVLRAGTLGMQIITSLVEQLEGSVEVLRARGTEFRVSFKDRGCCAAL